MTKIGSLSKMSNTVFFSMLFLRTRTAREILLDFYVSSGKRKPDQIIIFRDFSFNELDSDIPFSISKLKQLEFLSRVLKNNQLIGPIASTLSQIPNLKVLDLAQNKLSGEIPRLIYWNEVLQYLGLRGNNLVGTLSPDMCQLTGLWYFDVHNNSLTGSIPLNIGNYIAFQVLDLSHCEDLSYIGVTLRFIIYCLAMPFGEDSRRRLNRCFSITTTWDSDKINYTWFEELLMYTSHFLTMNVNVKFGCYETYILSMTLSFNIV